MQYFALQLFRALEKGMGQAIQLNIKDMAVALGVTLQLTPSSLWGEALHVSGLFAFIVKSLKDDKV